MTYYSLTLASQSTCLRDLYRSVSYPMGKDKYVEVSRKVFLSVISQRIAEILEKVIPFVFEGI